MSAADVCSYCGGGPTIYDPDTSATVCSACGRENSTDFFTSNNNSFANPISTSTSSAFISSEFTYHQRKQYHAKTLISDLTSRIGLSSRSSDEVLNLILHLTSSSFGAGEWFTVLVAAASYIVSRRHGLPLSINEAAAAAACDERQISRMVLRILSFLESDQLPDFDAASALERAVRTCRSFSEIESGKKEELIGMGRFLIQCMTKWFLMTGRRPLPAVAAVMMLVAEVNGVSVEIEDISKEIYAVTSTCRMRHRELKEMLLKVARALLPWGKDVNLKNLVHNMPILVRLMESKVRSANRKSGVSEDFEFNLDECLTVYTNADEEGSEYFRVVCDGVGGEEFDNVEISGERLVNAYNDVLSKIAQVRDSGGLDNNEQVAKKRRTRRELEDQGLCDSWVGRWDLGKKLSLEQVLERDVGFDALPPSFVNGIESREKRKLKIEAAKHRINRTMDPLCTADSPLEGGSLPEQEVRKKWSRTKVGIRGVDWEDCIIELLLLHQVDVNEIEEGQYNRLLELHVFNSLSSLTAQR